MLADEDTATALSPYRFAESAASIPPAVLVELAATARRLVALSLALPSRLANAGMLEEVFGGADEDWLTFVLEPPDGLDGCLSRPDLIYSDGRFRCIDVNAAHAGGWLIHLGWARQHGWSPTIADPLAAVCDMVHACARESGVATAGNPLAWRWSGRRARRSSPNPSAAPAFRCGARRRLGPASHPAGCTLPVTQTSTMARVAFPVRGSACTPCWRVTCSTEPPDAVRRRGQAGPRLVA